MLDPTITLKTAVRDALLSSEAITDLVDADSIRAGSTRPDRMPCIIMGGSQTQNLGRSGRDFVTRVWIGLHIWAVEDGAELAQQIGSAVTAALWDDPIGAENDADAYVRPSFQWISDPQPERSYSHGVATVESVIRWQL